MITGLIISDLRIGKFSIFDFYKRRARRIIPALFVVMSVSALVAWFYLSPSDMKGFSKSLVAVPLFSSNVLFWLESGYFDVGGESKPLLHTWSLAVEEQFYILFPFFLMLLWRYGRRSMVILLFVVFLISLSLAEHLSFRNPG